MLVHLKQQQQRKIKDKAIHSNCEYWHQRQQTKYPLLSGLFQWSGPVEGAGKVWWLENSDLHGHVLHRSKRNYNDRRTTWIELNWIPAATWSVYKAAARYIWLPSCALFFWLNKTDMGWTEKLVYNQGKRDSFVQFVPPPERYSDTLLLSVEQSKKKKKKEKQGRWTWRPVTTDNNMYMEW